MNTLWARYGCEKCTTYQVLVLTVNFADSKSSFQTDFITKYNVKTPCVPKEDGGATFNTALKNNNYGGPTYLICPDKSFIKSATEQTMIGKGIKPHVCPGGGDLEAPKVTVTWPTISTIVKVGAKHAITWTATDNVGVTSRVISFSSNGGTTWEKVDSGAGNTGTYSWTVPNSASKTCKTKIIAYDSSKNSGSGESAIFEIQPVVGTMSPSSMPRSIEFRQTPEAFIVYIPFSGEYEVTITDVGGKKLSGFRTSTGGRWYTVSNALSTGTHILSLKSARKTMVEKFWFVRH